VIGRPVDAIVLDVGETVLDRSREYADWAAFFGVPPHTFSAVFGALVSRGATVNQVLEFFGGGRSAAELRRQRPPSVVLAEGDLYPDARPAIAALAGLGVTVAVVGNQPAEVAEQLRALELGVAFVASSQEWGLAKPGAAFFARIAAELALPPARIAYVGDQLANDVAAPLQAGLRAIRLRRGPWGLLTSDAELEGRCLAVIDSLAELPAVLAARPA